MASKVLLESNTRRRFLLAGIWNTFFGAFSFVIAYSLFSEQLSLSYTSILLVTSFISILQAFYVQSRYVFRDTDFDLYKLLKFLGLNFLLFITNLVLMKFTADYLHWDPRISQVLIVGLIAFSSYVIQILFIFGRE